jgi:hypothetical protein
MVEIVNTTVPSMLLSTQHYDVNDYLYLQNAVDMVIYIVTVPIPPLLIVAGIVGNFYSFRLMNQKKYEKSTTCFYMRCMAVYDSLYIYGRMFLRYLLVVAPHLFRSDAVNKPFCLYYTASHVFGAYLSPWILVVMAVDRFIALTWPLKASTLCTMRRAKTTAVIIFILGAIVGGGQAMRTYKDTHKHWLCPYPFDKPWDDIFAAIEIVYITLLPIIFLVILNFGILFAVQRSRLNKSLNKTESASSDSSITIATIMVTSAFLFFQIFSDKMNNFFWSNWDGNISTSVRMLLKRLMVNVGILSENMNYCFNAYIYVLSCKRLRKEMFDIIFPNRVRKGVKSSSAGRKSA